MIKALQKLLNEKPQATTLEYALIASLIAVFVITAAQTAGIKVGAVFGEIGVSLH